MTLDLATLTLVLAALSFSSIFVLLIIWLVNRQMPGVFMWLIACILSTGSVVTNLLSAIDFLPAGIGPFASNCFSLIGGLLIMEGTLRFRFGVSAHRWRWLQWLIPLVILMSWLNRFDAPARYMFHDGVMTTFGIVSAVAMIWRTADLEEFRSCLLAAIGQITMAVALAGRGIVALVSNDSVTAGLTSTGTQWFLFAAVLFYINWTFGLSVACYSRSRREVMQLAREDELTGMPNRRSLDERLDMAMADARRNNEGFAVIMMDVNGFKRVNDELGHRAGDELLKTLATRLSQALRQVDYAGRLGGDEFLVIVRGDAALRGLDILITRLHDYLEGPVDLRDGRVEIRMSIGVAIWQQDGDTIDSMLRVADARMYQQKHTGNPMPSQARKLDAVGALN